MYSVRIHVIILILGSGWYYARIGSGILYGVLLRADLVLVCARQSHELLLLLLLVFGILRGRLLS